MIHHLLRDEDKRPIEFLGGALYTLHLVDKIKNLLNNAALTCSLYGLSELEGTQAEQC